MSMESIRTVRIEGDLEDGLSRWLWLVKWFLLIPHFIILAFLWLGVIVVTLISFVVLLFGGRYPQGLFNFNLGVLRWSWRVLFYSYGALATDRYPPFTMADVPDYPARLDVDYPDDQRHGFPLIGWWLAGIPQYVIAGLLAGVGAGASTGASGATRPTGGVIDALMVVVAILLLIGKGYPRPVFNIAMGFQRWAIRAGVYALGMTREYPPFRVDGGPREPGQAPELPPASQPIA
jgi:hypothetical protein